MHAYTTPKIHILLHTQLCKNDIINLDSGKNNTYQYIHCPIFDAIFCSFLLFCLFSLAKIHKFHLFPILFVDSDILLSSFCTVWCPNSQFLFYFILFSIILPKSNHERLINLIDSHNFFVSSSRIENLRTQTTNCCIVIKKCVVRHKLVKYRPPIAVLGARKWAIGSKIVH